MHIFQAIKNILKHIFPPPTKSFMREMNDLRNHLLVIREELSYIREENKGLEKELSYIREENKGLKKENEALISQTHELKRLLSGYDAQRKKDTRMISRSISATESAVLRQINTPFFPTVTQPLPVLNDKEIDIYGAMPDNESKWWGDLHYAVALKKEFERSGYKANIICADHWNANSTARYTLVLRGTLPYFPYALPGKKFIQWNISHPDDVPITEYNLYDYVFFASEKLYRKLSDRIRPASDYLLQCTDPETMQAMPTVEKRFELLFIGNSRGVYRKILADLLPTSHDLVVYGNGWDNIAPVKPFVVEKYLDNTLVGQAYHDAQILLNDHWEDMRKEGIVSNRIFDALAAGAFVISDYMPEIDELFEGAVVTYKTKEELQEKIDYYLGHADLRVELAEKGKRIVLEHHTFRHRVEKILSVMKAL